VKEPTIRFEEFQLLDIRIGTISSVSEFPKANKPAYQLIIDFGTLGNRKSSAQITHLYRKDDLVGKQVLAVVNFLPRQIANFVSEVLVLGVVDPASKVVLLQADKSIPNGGYIR
jgi:tRNA-binding protein